MYKDDKMATNREEKQKITPEDLELKSENNHPEWRK